MSENRCRNLKILLIDPEMGGGVSTFFNNLVNVLRKKGFFIKKVSISSFKESYRDFDIIHTCNILKRTLFFYWKARKKIVFSLHGNYKKESKKITKIFVWDLFLRKIFPWVTVPSYYLKKELNLDKAIVIPNGINLDQFKNIPPYEKGELVLNKYALLLLEVTNFNIWDKCKGCHELIKIYQEIKHLYPVRLVIAGSGKYLKEFEEKYKDVIFLGHRKDLLKIIKSSDIVTNYSKLDTFSYFILEAMALGKPIIANRVGGISEILEESGISCKNKNEYKEGLISLIKNPHLRQKLGEKALKRARMFDWGEIYQSFEKIYFKIPSCVAPTKAEKRHYH